MDPPVRNPADCPFCLRLTQRDVLIENHLAAAFYDAFPVSPGHALVVPKRHEPIYFDLTAEEQAAATALTAQVWKIIGEAFHPDGCNLGVNVGPAAGQTIEHVHFHIIPRYKGDASDPRGGVRWILPNRAPYWNLW